MSNIRNIIIGFDNLSDDEQLKFWTTLWDFADKQLPEDKNARTS